MAEIKHGGCGTPLYNVWKTMRQRCNNPNCSDYQWYGKLGVRVCDEWSDFANFRAWAIQNGYKKGLTIDRENGNGDYCPKNCHWITIQEQQKNKKNVLYISIDGERRTVKEICEKYGITTQMFYDRKHKGWSIERIINTPKVKTGGYRRKGVPAYRG